MTLIELLFFLLTVSIAIFVSRWSGHRFGWPGYIGGFVAGVLILPGAIIVLTFFEQVLYRGRPTFPTCREGVCNQNDYAVVKENDQWLLECRCGGRYRKSGKRFLEILPDGQARPYLIWKPFRGWHRE